MFRSCLRCFEPEGCHERWTQLPLQLWFGDTLLYWLSFSFISLIGLKLSRQDREAFSSGSLSQFEVKADKTVPVRLFVCPGNCGGELQRVGSPQWVVQKQSSSDLSYFLARLHLNPGRGEQRKCRSDIFFLFGTQKTVTPETGER